MSAAATIILASPTAALAQGAAARAPAESAAATELGDIVVTGTRIVRDGYKAPTPTTVIGAEQIQARAPNNLADFVNELPSLAGSVTPKGYTAGVSTGLVGINALNLRAIGPTRTLVLLDGRRVAASTVTGLVDINTIPQALVKRVDIVTGGASADWGSDAVAGVVNFVLDKDFTGVKGAVTGGVTTYGDDRNFNLSLSVGTRFADDRGHVMLSGEIAHNDGIAGIGSRKWNNHAKILTNPAYTATNGQPQLIAAANAGFATATPGGIITSGPLRGTYFGAGGTPLPFNYGSIVSGNLMIGGDAAYADFGESGDLDPRMNRQSIFGQVDYDVTDAVSIYAQGSYNRSTSRIRALDNFNFGNLTIQPDNAFIPASIRPQITAPFSFGTFNDDMGSVLATTRRSSFRAIVGAQGKFDAFGSNWSWDASAQQTVNRVYTGAITKVTPRYNQAIDAVRNANGVIVCRSTLTNPTDGCVPYNVFGTGVNGPRAIDYVSGTTEGRTKLTERVYAATFRGEPLSTWAGPVSVAFGAEHRTEKVSGSADPLSLTRSYFVGNYRPTFGSYHVTEGFIATVVPLAKDAPFAKSLDFNGAVRATDYSSSGYVTTWKAGLNYSPVSDITFRITRSRDIRAPNLAELFLTGSAATGAVADPFRNNTLATVFTITSGNLALKPEKADTLGLGVVVQPSFVPGFAASVDYYDIKIQDSITTFQAVAIVNSCFQGNTIFCPLITRDAAGVMTQVASVPVNIAKSKNRGLDFEASYRQPVLSGNLSFRVLATRFLKAYTSDGVTAPTDLVGTNSTLGSVRVSLPKWRYSATIGFDRDAVAMFLTARGFSAGKINTSYVECTSNCPVATNANPTINDNHMPGAVYFDANVTVKLMDGIESFVAIDNIANKDPYQMPYGPNIGANPISVNPVLYDVVGRSFRAGIRFKL